MLSSSAIRSLFHLVYYGFELWIDHSNYQHVSVKYSIIITYVTVSVLIFFVLKKLVHWSLSVAIQGFAGVLQKKNLKKTENMVVICYTTIYAMAFETPLISGNSVLNFYLM